MVYGHHVNFEKYSSMAGPAPSYSPILEAWRSGRITTKPRDYVLAVFPDISGYKVPLNARKMRFPKLVSDALGQDPIRRRFEFVPKVPKGMMLETSSKESISAWMYQDPSNIGEAYDPFLVVLSDEPGISTNMSFSAVSSNITLEEIDFSKSNISGVKDMWNKTADNFKHIVFVSISGPCTATTREAQTEQGLLQQYLALQFTQFAVTQFLPKSKLTQLEPSSSGVLSFDRVDDISDDIFRQELRRFLVCLICGTSLGTADIILSCADFRIVSTGYGKLFALVHRDTLSKARQEDYVLITASSWYIQGFLVGLRTSSGVIVVGRTAIPTSEFWDAMTREK